MYNVISQEEVQKILKNKKYLESFKKGIDIIVTMCYNVFTVRERK